MSSNGIFFCSKNEQSLFIAQCSTQTSFMEFRQRWEHHDGGSCISGLRSITFFIIYFSTAIAKKESQAVGFYPVLCHFPHRLHLHHSDFGGGKSTDQSPSNTSERINPNSFVMEELSAVFAIGCTPSLGVWPA